MSTLTTITGWVGANPVLTEAKNGSHFTTVRVATTDRFRNADQEWVDGPTQWFAVRLFGEFAQNAAASIRRSDPVIVTGRFVLDEWETEEKSGSSLVLYASAIGHDLSKGRSAFTRVVRGQKEDERATHEREAQKFETPLPQDTDHAEESQSVAVSA